MIVQKASRGKDRGSNDPSPNRNPHWPKQKDPIHHKTWVSIEANAADGAAGATAVSAAEKATPRWYNSHLNL